MLKQEFVNKNFRDKKIFQSKRRGHFEIVVQILDLCMHGKRKTNILYQANLSFTQVEKYIADMLLCDLVKQDGKKYFTTEKGKQVLDLFAELNEALYVSG